MSRKNGKKEKRMHLDEDAPLSHSAKADYDFITRTCPA